MPRAMDDAPTALSPASSPRLEEAEVVKFANYAMKRSGIRIKSFERSKPQFDGRRRTWTVVYQGREPIAEYRFFVIVEDRTGGARVRSRP